MNDTTTVAAATQLHRNKMAMAMSLLTLASFLARTNTRSFTLAADLLNAVGTLEAASYEEVPAILADIAANLLPRAAELLADPAVYSAGQIRERGLYPLEHARPFVAGMLLGIANILEECTPDERSTELANRSAGSLGILLAERDLTQDQLVRSLTLALALGEDLLQLLHRSDWMTPTPDGMPAHA